jgi:hypothetical protein
VLLRIVSGEMRLELAAWAGFGRSDSRAKAVRATPYGFRELTLPARRAARNLRADAHFARIFAEE